MKAPSFAVVGHPNKGKSSLVATLARDPSVRIGPEPGTTTQAREFPMRVGGEVLYTLVDTPGFQRARAALDWMRRHETDAASRAAIVDRFVREHLDSERFPDECALLRPIIEGAGIIYVVDGAMPYGPEYEAEMEILRWSGQPSMAIINPIGEPRFVDPWRRALEQFFRIVRVLDVLQAPFEQQTELLRAFGQMREAWRQPMDEAVRALGQHRETVRNDAARVIAEMMAAALTYRETRDIARDEDPRRHTPTIEADYRGRLRQIERRARAEVEAIYGHEGIDRREAEMELLDTDLLSRESWLAFGLKKRDLVAVGAVGGALTGGVVDAALLGASFLTGSLIGGLVGGALGFFSSNKLADVKVFRQPLGGTRLRCGPVRNMQFPFVLLRRALLHHGVVARRTHAQRDALDVGRVGESAILPLPDDVQRELARVVLRVRRSEAGSETRAALVANLSAIVRRLIDAGT